MASLLIIVLLFFGVFAVKNIIFPTLSVVAEGGELVYDEGAITEFASKKYGEIFSEAEKPDRNILLVVVKDNKGEIFCCYPLIGKGFTDDARHFFAEGDKANRVGGLRYIEGKDGDIADTLGRMEIFTHNYHKGSGDADDMARSRIINETDFAVEQEQKNDRGLKNFAFRTGIGICCLYANADDVFERRVSLSDILITLGCVAVFVIILAVLLVRIKRMKPSEKKGEDFVVAETSEASGDGDSAWRRERNARKDFGRYKKKDDRYRRGYDKSRYKKK